MSFCPSCYKPSLPSFSTLHSKGMKGRWYNKLSRSVKPRVPKFILPLLLFFPLHILLPPVLPHPLAPLSMPGCVLWIHLQIQQIYHSVMEAGKGGRLWNALALGAGKGSKQTATLLRTFPAAPSPAQSACLFSWSTRCPSIPPYPFRSYLCQPSPPRPSGPSSP